MSAQTLDGGMAPAEVTEDSVKIAVLAQRVDGHEGWIKSLDGKIDKIVWGILATAIGSVGTLLLVLYEVTTHLKLGA